MKKRTLLDKELKSQINIKRKEKFIQKEKKVAVQNKFKADQYESKIGVLLPLTGEHKQIGSLILKH